MLPEHLSRAMMTFYNPKAEQSRLKEVARLPQALREPAYFLMNRDRDGQPITYPDWTEETRQHGAQMVAALEALAPADRLLVFTALFGKLAEPVEATWQHLKGAPYQGDYFEMLPFRAPHDPALTLGRRAGWVQQLTMHAGFYDRELSWIVQNAGGMGPYDTVVAPLLSAAIDAGGAQGQDVFDTLTGIIRQGPAAGDMGQHVIGGLLGASRPDGWEIIVELLLNAGRQEGLRAAILRQAAAGHPGAFRRVLTAVVDHNLARFSATVQAANIWFGMGWEQVELGEIKALLGDALTLLDHAQGRAALLARGDGVEVFMALWASAFDDVMPAIPLAADLLADPDVERRFAAVYMLSRMMIPPARRALLPALEDDDLRVVIQALEGLVGQVYVGEPLAPDLFERLEAVLERFPDKDQTLDPLIWPWLTVTAERTLPSTLLLHMLGDRPVSRLFPHLPRFDPYVRAEALKRIGAQTPWDAGIRDLVVESVGDRAKTVRTEAFALLRKHGLEQDDLPRLEAFLTRKAGDLRAGVLDLLADQSDADALASAERLLASAKAPQRDAGLELVAMLAEKDRSPERCQALAADYARRYPEPNEDAAIMLDAILAAPVEAAPVTLDDALGLADPSQRTPPTPPQRRKNVRFTSKAGDACLEAIDALVHQHRDEYVPALDRSHHPNTLTQELLGNLTTSLVGPGPQAWFPMPRPGYPVREELDRLPLAEVWIDWYENRPPAQRDDDGLELVRAQLRLLEPDEKTAGIDFSNVLSAARALMSQMGQARLRYQGIVDAVLGWLVALYPPPGAVDLLLDSCEDRLATLPIKQLKRPPAQTQTVFMGGGLGSITGALRQMQPQMDLLRAVVPARQHAGRFPDQWTDAHHVRLWQMLHWLDKPFPGAPRERPHLIETLRAFAAGAATEADVYDHLLGPRPGLPGQAYMPWGMYDPLGQLTARRRNPLLDAFPQLEPLVARARDRVLEIELARGDHPTLASPAARALQAVPGAAVFVRLLRSLGSEPFVRGYDFGDTSRRSAFCHLLRVTYPVPEDTGKGLAALIAEARIKTKRLVEAAVYAPQWAALVEDAIDWPGLADAIWWVHAHTKDTNWHVAPDVREGWAAEISQRTPLTAEELLDGAVDVAWFHRAHAGLGAKRWQEVYAAAKYSSGGRGHTRARLFADAMLGKLSKADALNRIRSKRHQDSLRALGLIPLAAGDMRRSDLLERYEVMQEFQRTARKSGSQRRASEALAVRTGLANLARTAGFPDPVRLQWALESEAVADLREGPVSVAVDDVLVTLAIDAQGEPDLTIRRAGRKLKSVPAKYRQHASIQALRDRKNAIGRQSSRTRQALEAAMIRGDRFTGAELADLLAHPVVRPMLADLVWVLDDGSLGYPSADGTALRRHDGVELPLAADAAARLAHPYDLLQSRDWHHWQRDCFEQQRVQPFKQVFRELYVLTDAERDGRTDSPRYAGHQVREQQAMALFTARGWVYSHEEGLLKTFHDARITALTHLMTGFGTPLQVEDPTLEAVEFVRSGAWQSLPLTEVPPRVFSETMRDLDLVVSVAHSGGVDPESSLSTMEMRAALVRETAALLKLDNVRLEARHALVEGHYGRYSIHLGSATVHRQPGGALAISPVYSHHRGRLFLPFVDDDPRTAEVVSKVVLMAHDDQIKDPAILSQLDVRRGRSDEAADEG